MTTRGPVALACLCLFSAGFLAMKQTSSQHDRRTGQAADGVPTEVEQRDSRSASVFDEPQIPTERDSSLRQSITTALMPPPDMPFPVSSPKEQPGRLSAPKTAQPIPLDSKQLAILREAIKLELPNAKPGEIDILTRQWQGMPLHVVRDMLRIRRQFPLRGSGSGPQLITPLPIPSPHQIPNTPMVITPDNRLPFPVPVPVSPSVIAFRQARDVIVNNIANAKTPAFKRSRVIFGDLPSIEIPAVSPDKSPDRSPPSLLRIGIGVRVAAVQRDWSQGTLQTTGRKLDFAIQSRGFFVLSDGRRTIYTRRGNFQRDATGRLVLAIGKDSWRVRTIADKTVTTVNGGAAISVTALQLATFKNRDGLRPLGDCLFTATKKSGPATVHRGKSAKIGVIKSGCLEAFNVDLKHEQAELQDIVGQMKALRLAEEAFQDDEPHIPPRRPIVKKPGVQRMSGTAPKENTDKWIDDLIHSEKYREIERSLGIRPGN